MKVEFRGEVEQITDAGQTVRLHKEVVVLEHGLGLVRKHLPGGATAPPVLLVHGFAQNRYSWHTSTRSMSAWLAAQGFDVWNLELRGHGRSHTPGRQGAERFADYVEDVLQAAAHIGPAFWIGHSLGGAALYGAASQASVPPLGVIGVGALYTFAQHNPAIRALCEVTWRLRHTPLMGAVQIRTRLGGRLISRLYSLTDIAGYTFPISGWWPGSIEPALLRERLTIGFDWTSITVWQEMSRWGVSGTFDYDADWQKLDVPLLVLLGDKDHLLPPGDGRVAYDRSGSTDKTLVVLDDFHNEVHWGHLDLILGRSARKHVWRAVAQWMFDRSSAVPSATLGA